MHSVISFGALALGLLSMTGSAFASEAGAYSRSICIPSCRSDYCGLVFFLQLAMSRTWSPVKTRPDLAAVPTMPSSTATLTDAVTTLAFDLLLHQQTAHP